MAVTHFDRFSLGSDLKDFCRTSWIYFMKTYFPSFKESEVKEEMNYGIWMPVWKNTTPTNMKITADCCHSMPAINCGMLAYYEIVLALSNKRMGRTFIFREYEKALLQFIEKSYNDCFQIIQFIENSQHCGVNFDDDWTYFGKHIIQRLEERFGFCASNRDISNINNLIKDKKALRMYSGKKRDIYMVSYKCKKILAAYDRDANTICTVMPHEWWIRVYAKSVVYDLYGDFFYGDAA